MAIVNRFFPKTVFHPGDTLEEKLKEMGMDPKEFAMRTGLSDEYIVDVINGYSPITDDVAIQFESVTKIPAHFWMNSQRLYDEYLAR